MPSPLRIALSRFAPMEIKLLSEPNKSRYWPKFKEQNCPELYWIQNQKELEKRITNLFFEVFNKDGIIKVSHSKQIVCDSPYCMTCLRAGN